MAKDKKEHYVEDLKNQLNKIIKKCPKPMPFKRIVSLAEKGGYVIVIRG